MQLKIVICMKVLRTNLFNVVRLYRTCYRVIVNRTLEKIELQSAKLQRYLYVKSTGKAQAKIICDDPSYRLHCLYHCRNEFFTGTVQSQLCFVLILHSVRMDLPDYVVMTYTYENELSSSLNIFCKSTLI